MKKKRRTWKHVVGQRPYQVIVYERVPGGMLYAAAWDGSLRAGRGGQRRISLKHRDREAAKRYALEQAAKLAAGEAEIRSGRLTLARLFALYDEHEITRKKPKEAAANRRAAEMFVRALGAELDPMKLSRQGWLRVTDDRRSGAIDARGHYVPEEQRRPVRDCTVSTDLDHLASVIRWATMSKDRGGRYYLPSSPVRSRKEFPVAREKNPRRPVMNGDRSEALLAVADQVAPELPVLLTLAHETGRRISAILGLTYEDVNLSPRTTAPHGAITWRADTDKKGIAWNDVPITVAARAALERNLRQRPGIGAGLLFPSPKDPTRPLNRNSATAWLHAVERLAGLERLPGGAWHPFRRGWATGMKHAPDKDAMALGGWKDPRAFKTCYQHADPEGMLLALESRRELREAR